MLRMKSINSVNIRELRRRRKQRFLFLNNTRKSVLITTLIMSLLLAAVILTSSVFYYGLLTPERTLKTGELLSYRTIVSLIVSVFYFYILLSVQLWAINRYSIQQYQLWLILLGLLGGMLLLSVKITEMQQRWFSNGLPLQMNMTVLYLKDVVIVFLTFLFSMTIFLMKQNHNKVVEVQDLEIENLQNRYTALKSQTDPHFLFNSLNTLNGLIGEDDQRAREYVQQLAQVFRHSMRNKMVVHLSEELDFAHSYLYLMCIRYFDCINVNFDIDPQYLDYYVIPSALQILLENAIKHNVATLKNPLSIDIRTTKDAIEVVNKLQRRELHTVDTSSGVGLENLMEQYRLIFNKDISIVATECDFMVSLPLVSSLSQLEPRAKALI